MKKPINIIKISFIFFRFWLKYSLVEVGFTEMESYNENLTSSISICLCLSMFWTYQLATENPTGLHGPCGVGIC